MPPLDPENGAPPPTPRSDEISGWDVIRVILMTLSILFAGYMVIAAVGLWELGRAGIQPDKDAITKLATGGMNGFPDSMKVLTLLVQASLILPVWLYLRKRGFSMRKHLRLHIIPFSFLGYAVVIGGCIAVLGDELTRIVDLVLPMPEEQVQGLRDALRLHGMFDLLTIGLTVILVAPVVEEALFRGFFQRYFESKRGVTSGVLAASALFAAYHFNIFWLIPILLMATVIGAMAWRTESIWPAVVVHGTNNGIGLIAANSGSEDPSWYALSGHVAPWWLLLALVVLIVALRAFFRSAEQIGLGGHGPSGDSGANINLTV